MPNGWIFVKHGETEYTVDLAEDIVKPEPEHAATRMSVIRLAQEKAGLINSTLSAVVTRERKINSGKHFRRPGMQ